MSTDTRPTCPPGRSAPRPIASRLFRAVVPGIVLALALGGLTLDILIGRRLEQGLDSTLDAKVQALRALTEIEDGVVEIEPHGHALPAYAERAEADYFVMLDRRGEPIARSASLGSATWLDPPASGSGPGHRDLWLPDGRAGRAVEVRFVPPIDDTFVDHGRMSVAVPLTLVIAASREPLDRTLRSVHLGLVCTALALTLLIIALARQGIRTTLAPLERLGEQLTALDPARLEQRLVVASTSTELDRLASRFNALLGRLELALQRERQFSANVAQALRTPLAELRALGEVSVRWTDDPEDRRRRFLADHAALVVRMERTVTNLLALARREGDWEGTDGPCDLVSVIERSVETMRERAASRGLSVELVLPGEPFVMAGAARWGAIVDHLLDDAIEHAIAGTGVHLALSHQASEVGATLSVTNRVAGLRAEDLPTMFERPWRKGPAHDPDPHGGFGLALVHALTRRLGIEPSATLDADGRLVVTLSGLVPVSAQAARGAPPEQLPPITTSRDGRW